MSSTAAKPTLLRASSLAFAGLAGTLLFAGCASGESGLVLSRSTFTRKALVVDSYVLGWGVSFHPATAGTMLGYRHTAYLYARQEGDPAPSVGRGTWFHTPLPDRPLQAVAVSQAGVELAAHRSDFGLSFGLENSFAQRLPVNESTILQLRYHPASPAETVVEIQSPPSTHETKPRPSKTTTVARPRL